MRWCNFGTTKFVGAINKLSIRTLFVFFKEEKESLILARLCSNLEVLRESTQWVILFGLYFIMLYYYFYELEQFTVLPNNIDKRPRTFREIYSQSIT